MRLSRRRSPTFEDAAWGTVITGVNGGGGRGSSRCHGSGSDESSEASTSIIPESDEAERERRQAERQHRTESRRAEVCTEERRAKTRSQAGFAHVLGLNVRDLDDADSQVVDCRCPIFACCG